MDETVQIHGRLVDLQEALVIQVLAIWRVGTQYHLHGLIEPRDALLQAKEVERVLDVVELNLYKEFVAFQITEPLDPAAV